MWSWLKLVLPPWVAPLCIVAGVAVIELWVYNLGYHKAEIMFTNYRAKEIEAQAEEIQRISRLKSEVDVVWLRKDAEIQVKYETKIKEVPKYITSKADSACTIPVGFVRLWNDAGPMPKDIYQPSSDVDAAAPGVALHNIGEQIRIAQKRFEINKITILECQDFLRKLEK